MKLTNDVWVRWKQWNIALRTFSFSASVIPVLFGSVLALTQAARFRWIPFLLALMGVLCLHAAANLLNDVFDYRRGLDRAVHPASGALVRGWLGEKQLYRVAIVLCVLGCACGLLLVWLTGWGVAVLVLCGVVLALTYTRDGLCLKYTGLGDLAILLAFGILPVLGAWWVQVCHFAWMPVLWSVPMAGPTVGILHANNWRDRRSDAEHGCQTLAGRLSEEGCRRYFLLLIFSPFLLVTGAVALRLAGLWNGPAPLGTLLALLALPLALCLTLRDAKPDSPRFAMLDARTAQFQLLFGALLIAGFLLDILPT